MVGVVSVDGGYLSVLPGMLAMGAGTGLAMTSSTEAITSALPREHQGVASALNDVTREFGTALGVALLGALLSAGYRNAIDAPLDGVPGATAETAREGVANALDAAHRTGPRTRAVADAARKSFVDGRQQAMWAGVAVMAVLSVCVLARGPRRPAPPRRTDRNRPTRRPVPDPETTGARPGRARHRYGRPGGGGRARRRAPGKRRPRC